MINSAWLVPLLPLLGGLVAAAGGRWLRERAHWPVIVGIGLAFVASLPLLTAAARDQGGTTVVYEWIDAGNVEPTTDAGQVIRRSELHVPIEFRVDGLSTMMLSMVTFVATLVAVFAAGYMAGDPGYARFFAVIGLFVFSMTGLVLSNNFVLTYAFWEGVGVCSYLLVGFWHAKPAAAAAAKKAFLVNRVGDFGFAVALFWMWSSFGHSTRYDDVLDPNNINLVDPFVTRGIGLLLLWAATAKSAQIPLYVWLPDAMEGPTPVSALIHAATMVTAGVYLVARSSALVFADPVVPLVICVVGCATALLAAAIAVTQTDLKRVLAYSTVSQLGFMFMGLGAGVGDVRRLAIVAAMFHLFTHAFFKALLFLGSGSVMHAMGGVIDMRRFRGLRHRLPITCMTFAVGSLALAGIPPFAGFFSKDEILSAVKGADHAAHEAHHGWAGAYTGIYWLAVLTALLTAFYTGRAFFLTFFGPEKLPSPDDPEADPSEAHGHAHGHAAPHPAAEAPIPPALPDLVAASESKAALESDPHRPADLPAPTPGATDEPVPQGHGHGHGHGGHDSHFGHESPPIMWVPLAVLAACALIVGFLFGPATHGFEHLVGHTLSFPEAPHEAHATDWMSIGLGTLAGVLGLLASWWLYAAPNPVPATLAGRLGPLYRASREKFRVDELYEALVVRPTRALAAACKFIDIYVVDGLVRLAAWVPRFVGRELLGPFQNGLVQFYAAATALGLVGMLVLLLMWM